MKSTFVAAGVGFGVGIVLIIAVIVRHGVGTAPFVLAYMALTFVWAFFAVRRAVRRGRQQ